MLASRQCWARSGSPAAAIRRGPGARDLIAKIRDVAPEHLRPMILQSTMVAPNLIPQEPNLLDLERIRASIRDRAKLWIRYRDPQGRSSERRIWPISVAYFQAARLLVAWCELRGAFRHFRTDRIEAVEFLAERYPMTAEALRAAWRAQERGTSLCKSAR